MRYLKDYNNFTIYNKTNEEFIGKALGKLANLFMAPFKDLAKDFEKMFKEEDPNSIKSVILTNFNQAIDGAQKEIPNIQDDASIVAIIDNVVDSLIKLANNIGKDVETALGKGKSKPVIEVSKALILGSKEADFVGIVGLLDPTKGITKKDINYKFSKSNYQKQLATGKDLKSKKDIANKFFDGLQKDISVQLDKDFTKEEIDELYNKFKNKEGKSEYKAGDTVVYKRDKFNEEEWKKITDEDKKKTNEGPVKDLQDKEMIGIKKIKDINGDDISFEDADFKKKIDDILMKVEGGENEDAKKAAESLSKIKNDPEKMKKVANFSDFLQDEKNKDKVAEIEKIISGEA